MLLTFMLLLALIVTGCGSGGNHNEASKPVDANEPMMEPEDDPASVEPGETAVETPEADSGKGSGSRPDGLPGDFPIADGANITGELKTSDESSTAYTVSYDVGKDFDSVSKVYQDYIKDKGYTETSEMTSEGTYLITGMLNGDSLWLTVSESTDGSGLVQVVIIYTVPKQ